MINQEKILLELGENLDLITNNEKRMVLLLEELSGENEELRKHQWILIQIVKKLRQDMDNLSGR